jgi:hypothetical protein
LNEIPKAEDEKRPYFAFGSNLSLDQMRKRCPGHELAGIAVLANHRVVCNKAKSDGVNYCAGIIQSPGDEVLGALYKLTPGDIKSLDKEEGCWEGTEHYFRDAVDFYVKNRATGEVINAFTYFVARPVAPQKPAPEYAEIIFQGCRHHGLPEEYVKNLRRSFLMEPETP